MESAQFVKVHCSKLLAMVVMGVELWQQVGPPPGHFDNASLYRAESSLYKKTKDIYIYITSVYFYLYLQASKYLHLPSQDSLWP